MRKVIEVFRLVSVDAAGQPLVCSALEPFRYVRFTLFGAIIMWDVELHSRCDRVSDALKVLASRPVTLF